MVAGYMGKILNVDLTSGKIEEEVLDEGLLQDYIGGYGLGAKLLYDRMPAGADPLGPDNILGILTGPLTGTPAVIGSRFVVVGKSPLTGTWGDANCGGFFGPRLKFAGFDGILVRGISDKPVYLFVDEGVAELRDAEDLWGLGVTPLEDLLKERHGKIEVCSIGPAGEKLALTACVMNDKERAAGRSGLGAVMGAKKLKAVVAKGSMKVPVADQDKLRDLRREIMGQAGPFFDILHKEGTPGTTAGSIMSGDAPVKNWGGSGGIDFSEEQAEKISGPAVVAYEGYKPYGCWGCPIRCGGKMKQAEGDFALELNEGIGHKPEYETLAMTGSNLLNDNLASIVKINEICNNLGLDTISVGAVIAYAIECYENGLLTKEDTDGLELTWGNAQAIVALSEKIGKREGFGDVLADGIEPAWRRLGEIGTEYAIQIGGEEVPAHDPKFVPGLATTYRLAPTPGRHTQGGELVPPPGFEMPDEPQNPEVHGKLVAGVEVVNAAGLCLFGWISYPADAVPNQLAAATGWDYDLVKVYEVGTRIFTMRHLFNLREGQNPLTRAVPGRLVGEPPFSEGPNEGVTIDYEKLNREFLRFLDWDTQTTIPTREALQKLGMDFAVEDLDEFDVPPVEA